MEGSRAAGTSCQTTRETSTSADQANSCEANASVTAMTSGQSVARSMRDSGARRRHCQTGEHNLRIESSRVSLIGVVT